MMIFLQLLRKIGIKTFAKPPKKYFILLYFKKAEKSTNLFVVDAHLLSSTFTSGIVYSHLVGIIKDVNNHIAPKIMKKKSF